MGSGALPRLLIGAISWSEFWNANIFHPDPLALALSEHLFGQTLQILPVYWLTGNIILCYNLLFISSFALSAFGTYLLVRDLTGDKRAAFIAGLVYGFLPYRIASVPHLQVMSSQWMPFALWGLNRFITSIPDPDSRRPGVARPRFRNRRACAAELVVRLLPALLRALRAAVRAASHVDLGTLHDVRTWALLMCSGSRHSAFCRCPSCFHTRRRNRSSASSGRLARSFPSRRMPGRTSPHRKTLTLWGRAFASPRVLRAKHFSGSCRRAGGNRAGHVSRGQPRAIARPWTVCRGCVAQDHCGPDHRRTQVDGAREHPDLRWIRGPRFGPAHSRPHAGAHAVPVGRRGGTTARGVATHARPGGAAGPIARGLFSLCVTVLAMWLSLGPMPSDGDGRARGFGIYAVLYDYVPGFNGVRVPARYAMIAGLFLAVLAGYGTRALLDPPKPGAMSSGRRRTAMAVVAVLILVEGAAVPMEINRGMEHEPGYATGASLPGTRERPARLCAHRRPAAWLRHYRVSVRRRGLGDSIRLLLGRALEANREWLQRLISAGIQGAPRAACNA